MPAMFEQWVKPAPSWTERLTSAVLMAAAFLGLSIAGLLLSRSPLFPAILPGSLILVCFSIATFCYGHRSWQAAGARLHPRATGDLA